MYIFHSEISRIGIYTFLSGFSYLSQINGKGDFIMRKEQITVTNNSVCNSAENKGLEGKGMKRRLLHFKKRMVPALSGALMGVMLMSTTCFAAGAIFSQSPVERLISSPSIMALPLPERIP